MSNSIQRNEWIFGNIKNIIDSKEEIMKSIALNLLTKASKMFKYTNLPDTINHKDLETQLLVGGYSIWKEVNGELYTFRGGLGGIPDPYYLPTKAIIANPALNYNAELEIDKECVVMLNDYYYQGIMPIVNKYAGLLAEAETTLKYAIWNARIPALVQADNESTHKSAEEFFNKVIKGKEYGVISSKEFFDGIRSHDFYKETHIKDTIEAIQYIKGSGYNEIGLNAAFNMKREAINEAEASLNEDILYPLVDVMLECRKEGLKKVNAMYNRNIGVELDSVWAINRNTEKLQIERIEAEIEEIKDESEVKTNNEIEGNTINSEEN